MSVNMLTVGAQAACGWYDEQYHYNMQEFSEWYRKLSMLGTDTFGIEALEFIKLMDRCQVPEDYKFEVGYEDVYVWDFNSETVIIASTLPGIAIQCIDYAEWYEWYASAPKIIEKTCATCKHIDTKSGTEPCYSCDALVGSEFNWEPQESE